MSNSVNVKRMEKLLSLAEQVVELDAEDDTLIEFFTSFSNCTTEQDVDSLFNEYFCTVDELNTKAGALGFMGVDT